MINNNIHKIYVHINKINGKMYIGQTCLSLERRAGKDGKLYLECPIFGQAIKKYGWNNFSHIVLIDNLSQEEANIIEKELIKKYDTISNGYNIAPGGKVLSGKEHPKSKPVICIETNQEYENATLAAQSLGLKNPDGIARVCRGERLTCQNLHWIYKEDYSLDKVEQILNKQPKQQKTTSVRNIETGLIFNSLQEAANWAGLKTKCNISSCCTGNRETAGKIPGTNTKCHWEYVITREDDNNAVG